MLYIDEDGAVKGVGKRVDVVYVQYAGSVQCAVEVCSRRVEKLEVMTERQTRRRL